MENRLSIKIVSVKRETAEASSFEFYFSTDTTNTVKCGQFITLHLDTPEGLLKRSYSLSSCQEVGEINRFTVKRNPNGRGSNIIMDTFSQGTVVLVDEPAGRFFLHPGSKAILAFAAGSGITPIIGVIKTALKLTGTKIKLVYTNKTKETTIFLEELEYLSRIYADRFRIIFHFSSMGGRLDVRSVRKFIDNALVDDIYICGPTKFMDFLDETIVQSGFEGRVFSERFATDIVAKTDIKSVDVAHIEESAILMRLDGVSKLITWHSGQSILDAITAAGVSAPSSCREGRCGACLALVAEGEVSMPSAPALSPRDRSCGRVLVCQATPLTTSVTVDFDI